MPASRAAIVPLTYTITGAAKRMGVARCTLSALVRDGDVAYVLIRSAKTILESAIHDFLSQRRIAREDHASTPLTEVEIAQYIRRMLPSQLTQAQRHTS